MSRRRPTWPELPEHVRDLIEARLGESVAGDRQMGIQGRDTPYEASHQHQLPVQRRERSPTCRPPTGKWGSRGATHRTRRHTSTNCLSGGPG
jgi:hypothetical protein